MKPISYHTSSHQSTGFVVRTMKRLLGSHGKNPTKNCCGSTWMKLHYFAAISITHAQNRIFMHTDVESSGPVFAKQGRLRQQRTLEKTSYYGGQRMTSSSAHGSVLILRDYISLPVAESAWTAPTDGPLMGFNTRSRESRLPTLAARLKVNRNIGNSTVDVMSTPN